MGSGGWAPGGDLTSELLPQPDEDSRLLPLLVCLRVLFVPLFMLCHVPERSRLPVLFPQDAYFITFMLLFAVSNGYLVSLTMCLAPRSVAGAGRSAGGGAQHRGCSTRAGRGAVQGAGRCAGGGAQHWGRDAAQGRGAAQGPPLSASLLCCRQVLPHEREVAGALMTFFLALGLSCGASLSFLFKALL